MVTRWTHFWILWNVNYNFHSIPKPWVSPFIPPSIIICVQHDRCSKKKSKMMISFCSKIRAHYNKWKVLDVYLYVKHLLILIQFAFFFEHLKNNSSKFMTHSCVCLSLIGEILNGFNLSECFFGIFWRNWSIFKF